MPLPNITDIDQMKDSDLIFAADLKGKTVTVEITDINARDFEDEDEKHKKMYLLSFKGSKKFLGINRTNQLLLSKMFGRNPNAWVGKRVGIYPTQTRMAGETVPCIRVYGSPEISQDITVKQKLGRMTVKATLHAMQSNGKTASVQQENREHYEQTRETIARGAQAPGPQFSMESQALSPELAKVNEAFQALNIPPIQQAELLKEYDGKLDDLLTHLNRLAD